MRTIQEKIGLRTEAIKELGKSAPENSKINLNGKQFEDLILKKMLETTRLCVSFLKQQPLLAFVYGKKMILTETILFSSQSEQLRFVCSAFLFIKNNSYFDII